jgi:two-component system sensor histidine kinase DesK
MFNSAHRLPGIVVVLVLVTGFCAAYISLAMRNRSLTFIGSGTILDRPRMVLLGSMAAIAAVTPVLSSNSWVVLWVYVSSAAGATLPIETRNYAFLGGLAATAFMSLEAGLLGTDIGEWMSVLLPCIFAGLGMVGIRRMQRLIVELRQAREEVKHLAANEERLRLARDLHDLAGHSMATITLKAELARRLVKADVDAAERQITDIERVSRQALADIREAVSGYRRPTLAVETASARTALEAAGIAFELDTAVVACTAARRLDPEAEAALAWCLREAVTNVVRHSGATRCSVRLIEARVDGETTLTLEVTDDGDGSRGRERGRGGDRDSRDGDRDRDCDSRDGDRDRVDAAGASAAATPTPADHNHTGPIPHTPAPAFAPVPAAVPVPTATPAPAAVPAPAWGNGLTGLHERLIPFDATLRAVPLSPRGFQLTATLPVG